MTDKFTRRRKLGSGRTPTTDPLVDQGESIGIPPEQYQGAWAYSQDEMRFSDGNVWRPVVPLGTELSVPDWVNVPNGWFETGNFDAAGNRIITNRVDLRYYSDLILARYQARLGFFPTADRGLRNTGTGGNSFLTQGGASRIAPDITGATIYRVRARVRAIGTEDSRIYVGVKTWNALDEPENTQPGTHRYAAAQSVFVPNDGEWYIYEGEISGNGNTSNNEFRPTTAHCAPILLANYIQDSGAVLEVDELSFADVTGGGDTILNDNPFFADGLLNWDESSGWETRESGGLWTTADQAVNVTAPPSLVGYASDTSGRDNDAIQTISANRPTFDEYGAGHPYEGLGYFDFSTIDSNLVAQVNENSSFDCWVATEWGVIRYRGRFTPDVTEINLSGMGADIWYDATFIGGFVDNDEGTALAQHLEKTYGWPPNTTGQRTDWTRAFYGNNSLRSIAYNSELVDWSNATDITEMFRDCPLLYAMNSQSAGQFSNVVTATRAFQDCVDLTLNNDWDFSSAETMDFCFKGCVLTDGYTGDPFPALTSAEGTWQDCTALEDFPAGLFDASPCTNYANAWDNCALTEASVDNILVSIDTARAALTLTNGTIGIAGGTNATPSVGTGQPAVDNLRAAGWTVNVVGY